MDSFTILVLFKLCLSMQRKLIHISQRSLDFRFFEGFLAVASFPLPMSMSVSHDL